MITCLFATVCLWDADVCKVLVSHGCKHCLLNTGKAPGICSVPHLLDFNEGFFSITLHFAHTDALHFMSFM